jgi:hypothetical protein
MDESNGQLPDVPINTTEAMNVTAIPIISKAHEMIVLEDIGRRVSRLSPNPVCDDRIAERLSLSVRQHANQKTRELAGIGGYRRNKASAAFAARRRS